MREQDAIPALLHRVDPARNMARYYSAAIEPTLFGWAAVARDWGRMGRSGRRRLDLYDDMDDAASAADDLIKRKLQRGYIHEEGRDPA